MTVALDCYATNPRGYFDLDLRDATTRKRFESLRVQRIDQCVSHAPFAVELRYNSLRFRDGEPRARRPGVRRIAILGDSFTEGEGVRERDAYPRVLERVLNATGGGQWEVLNFGRRGADFPALFDTFEELLAYEPDVVVYAMVLNDCEQPPSFEARHALVTARVAGPPRRPDPLPTLPLFGLRTWQFAQDRLELYRLDRAMRAWYRELYAEANREGWERSKGYIREMNRRMRLRGGLFHVATWPILSNLDGDYPFEAVHEAVESFCLAAGVPWVDLLPVLRGRPADALWVHPTDAHPNAIAHRLVADQMAAQLRRLADR
jgi:lysophospholipase L1-like esterase